MIFINKTNSTLVTLLIKLILNRFEVEMYTRKNYAILPPGCESEANIWQNIFVPVLKTGLECSYRKIFITVSEISVGEPGWPVFSYEHLEIFSKEIQVRRDIGRRASAGHQPG